MDEKVCVFSFWVFNIVTHMRIIKKISSSHKKCFVNLGQHRRKRRCRFVRVYNKLKMFYGIVAGLLDVSHNLDAN